MNRRGFLRAIMLAPALPVAAMLPAAASPSAVDMSGRVLAGGTLRVVTSPKGKMFYISGIRASDNIKQFFAFHKDQLAEILHRHSAT